MEDSLHRDPRIESHACGQIMGHAICRSPLTKATWLQVMHSFGFHDHDIFSCRSGHESV